jgi:hypothetical protein
MEVSNMHTPHPLLGRIAGLIALGAAFAIPAPRAAAADSSDQADAFPSYESYIKISGQSAWINGDDAAFAAHSNTPAAGSYGIEDLLFTKDISNASTITVKGRALGGAEDYLASIDLETINVGSIEAGYKRFRTFYDGVGGFFPLANQFERLTPEQLHVDRGSFWVSAKLAKPDRPVFTISFHDEVRTGMKDSTEWAAIINPEAVIAKGALVGTALPANTPFINPNVQEMDEHHRILETGVTAAIGKTTETLKATFDWVNNVDERDYVKYPNSKVIADPTVMVQDDQEARVATTFRLLQQTETEISSWLALDVGLTYSHLSSTNGGVWLTPTYSSTANAVYTADTAADIFGGSKLDDYVGNVFLKFTPSKNWQADLGCRDEFNVVGSNGGFTTTTLATGSKTVALTSMTTSDDLTYSHFIDHTVTPEASVQYLGFDRVSLYGTVDDCIDHGTQHWINPYAATTITGAGVATMASVPVGSVFFQDANQDYDNVKIGANWNESSVLTIRAEVFRKDHQNRFIGSNDIIGTGSYGGLFVTGYNFTGVKLSVIYKPLPQLSFNTRYQPQTGDMSVTAGVANGGLAGEITSGKARGQQISESVNWTPSGQIYLQGNVNVVYNYIQTAYPIVVESATTNIATPIQNANNNYVVGSALCGFVLSKSTDAQLSWSWERANNYNPQIAAGGQPYGASFEIQSVTAGLKHKFTSRLLCDCKVGYLESTDPTTGGFTNYHGPLAYVALTYSL